MQKMPYSYHTFMYPFSYKDEIKINEQIWEKNSIPEKEAVKKEAGQKTATEKDKKDILLYNEYQYFLLQARRIIFNSSSDDSVSMHYRFKAIESQNDNTYSIKLSDEENYELLLNDIRLSVYPRFRIGLLTFETEYYPEPGGDPFSDVLDINDYGRRLFAPCIGENFKSILTADEISIHINNTVQCQVQFNKDRYENEQEIEFIKQILGIENEDEAGIKSILDDRMFVACLIRDDHIGHTPFLKNLHRSMKDDEQKEAEQIYQFIFIDNKKGSSCQSLRMLDQELRDHVYDRWVNYGTFHGITEYSFVCATGESDDVKGSVINPFLTIYVDMAKLALVQRAALTKIESEIPQISDEEIKEEKLDEIRRVWKNYVLFQSRLCLSEVTFQRQGIELYQVLKEVLEIDTMNLHLGEQLDNLHNVAELQYQLLERKSDDKINDILNYMTFAGLALALISMAQDFFFGINSFEGKDVLYVGVVGIVIWMISFYIMHGTDKLSEEIDGRKKHKMKEKYAKNGGKNWFIRSKWIVYAMLFISIIIFILRFY